jgi:alkanesulfonate monooxygenase SsuD/methylene tetrahydromethanopterin reductase-like flavin-dependent oxidoreductase (luciferase family)
MEFATLEAMFPGRVQIAVGHGVQSWMRQTGSAVASPLTLLREYVTALRALLSGDEVTVEGRYVRLSDVRLEFPPARHLPILVGGTGPKTLRLAGEIADGVLVDSRYSTRTVLEALGHVAAGRSDARPFRTTMFLTCVPGESAKRTLAEEAVRQEVPEGDTFGVGGTVEDIVDGLAPYRDAGVDAISLQPVGPLQGMTGFVVTAGEVYSRISGDVTGDCGG